MKKTERQRIARIEALARDPAVASNLNSHLTAMRLMLTESLRIGSDPRGAILVASFTPNDTELRVIARTTRTLDAPHVLLAFDVRDPTGSPTHVEVIGHFGEEQIRVIRCELRSSPEGGRAILVPLGSSGDLHMVLDDDGRLALKPGVPASFGGGRERAAARLARHAGSPIIAAISQRARAWCLTSTQGSVTAATLAA